MGMTWMRGLAFVIVAVAAGCAGGAGEAKEYELTGQVLAVDVARQEVTIRHEDIPQFMPGMTMAFRVREPELLTGRVPGDLVAATLVVAGEDVHLRRLERTGFAPLPEGAVAAARLLEPGDSAGEATFVDQTGAIRELASWRGEALAVTFTYTRCPLPNFCPLIDRHFQRVQEQIRNDPALAGATRLLSVSVDPAHDTPAVLAAHAAAVNADPAVWMFLTGDPASIRTFAARFGVAILTGDGSQEEIVHNLRTAVIDPDGRLTTVFGGGDWEPAELTAALRDARGRR
jgi:protein SCO1